MAAFSPFSSRPASLRIRDAFDFESKIPSSMDSTETYSSPIFLEMSTAFCRASLDSRERNTSPPETFGSAAISLSSIILTVPGLAPIFWKMKFTMVSASEMIAFSRWTGSICC